MSWWRHCHLVLPHAPAGDDNELLFAVSPFQLSSFFASLNQKPALTCLRIQSLDLQHVEQRDPTHHTAKQLKESHSRATQRITQPRGPNHTAERPEGSHSHAAYKWGNRRPLMPVAAALSEHGLRASGVREMALALEPRRLARRARHRQKKPLLKSQCSASKHSW